MLLRIPVKFDRFGAILMYDVSEVVSLDNLGLVRGDTVFGLNRDVLLDYASKTAIVIPVKDEDLSLLEGVISAIPLASPIIIVSASSTDPVNVYKHELEIIKTHSKLTKRRAIVVHQRDEAWNEALSGTILEELLDSKGVRYGKGEGMVLGVLVASWLGARYVGFIDSDNYIPGSAHEYALAYYTGLAMANSRYSMVRIVWHYKSKMPPSDIILRKWGRVSAHTNSVLNKAITSYRRIETDVVKTANSGEHAMTIDLAMSIQWAGKYAIETYQLVYLLESCYLSLEFGERTCEMLPEGVKIIQVMTRNPHIHSEKGDEHIARMAAESLGAIFYSSLANSDIKTLIKSTLIENYHYYEDPPRPPIYSLEGVDPSKVISRYLMLSSMALDITTG